MNKPIEMILKILLSIVCMPLIAIGGLVVAIGFIAFACVFPTYIIIKTIDDWKIEKLEAKLISDYEMEILRKGA